MHDMIHGVDEGTPDGLAVAFVTIIAESFNEILKHPANVGLADFNQAALGEFEHRPVVVTARDAEDVVIGGAIGDVFLGWLNIQVLWVAAPWRRKGVGTRIVGVLESEAKSLGAERACVDTVAFQAPDFYVKLRYMEFGRIKNFVQGHDRIYLEKRMA